MRETPDPRRHPSSGPDSRKAAPERRAGIVIVCDDCAMQCTSTCDDCVVTYVLRADDDPERFAAVLRSLGVSYKLDIDPFPIFYGFSRRVGLEEVAGFRGEEESEPSAGES